MDPAAAPHRAAPRPRAAPASWKASSPACACGAALKRHRPRPARLRHPGRRLRQLSPLPAWKRRFSRKVGVDQIAPAAMPAMPGAILGPETLATVASTAPCAFPFPDAGFSCVSSLAVIEHLEPDGLPVLLAEIHRVLKPSGQLVLTTPHAWADGILRPWPAWAWSARRKSTSTKAFSTAAISATCWRRRAFRPAKSGSAASCWD